MSYALLWIESLLTALLLAATTIAFAARSRRKWLARLPVFFVLALPFLAFGALAFASAIFNFSMLLEHSWFAYTLSLFLAYVFGVVVLLVRSRKLSTGEPGRFATMWPCGRLALGLLTAAVITCMTLWNMDLEARSQAANLRIEAGAMMLSVSPPLVGDSRNAALLYERAFAKLEADKTAMNASDSPLNPETPDEKNPATADLLKRHELTIKLLHKAATMPDGRFEHDYAHPSISMLLPELSQSRAAGRLLWLHARDAQSHGQIDSAVADVNAIFQLSKIIGNEPILVSELVSIALDNIGIKAMEDLLPAITKPEQLAALDIGESPGASRMIGRCFQGEEAFGLSIFSDLGGGRMGIGELMPLLEANGWQQDYNILNVPPTSILMRVFLLPDDVAAYRRLFQEYHAAFAQPYYKSQPSSVSKRDILSGGLLTRLIAPALNSVIVTAARSQATHLGAQAAIAMTRYRLAHGNYPASLDLLVPEYLDETPVDPFDGKPLRLVEKGDEWIVYSIGPDGKDDGGAPYDSKTKTGDIAFVLKSVK